MNEQITETGPLNPYAPPCAFTPFATCPLPPKQNRLTVAVRAGEKRYGKSTTRPE